MGSQRHRLVDALIVVNVGLAVWYFSWLLSPAQVGTWWLYGFLVAAELFNLVQAAGFWWTVRSDRPPPAPPTWTGPAPRVDVLIPTYNEPLDVVEPTVIAATKMIGAETTVYLLDDGARPEMEEMAVRHGARYVARQIRSGAKAGNINHALALTDAPFVAVFDCDHVPMPEFLEETMGHLAHPSVAFVQTPQHYANGDTSPVAAAAAAQQDLFFGTIARGKQAVGAMFCCGTNFVFRRAALEQAGGFPVDSLTEDFELSMRMHELGWTSAYVPTVLAHGLGPEDMASYVSQQARWAEGCLSSLGRIVTYRLPWRLRAHYLLAASYFLSGWAVLIYMSLPVLRIFAHVQPIHQGSADQFLVHFSPYFAFCVLTIAVASEGRYSFAAYSLAAANFGVHLRATVRLVTGRQTKWVVTPKHGDSGRQLRPVIPALVAVAALLVAVTYALITSRAPSSLTNVAFASIHLGILSAGIWSAVLPAARHPRSVPGVDLTDAALAGPTLDRGSQVPAEADRMSVRGSS